MNCPVCDNQNIILKYPSNLKELGESYNITDSRFGVHGDIYQCRKCQLAWVGNTKIAEQAISCYGAENFDEAYEKERDNRKKTAGILVRKIKEIKPQGKLLDIGCYSGIFLEAAEEAGYEIFGIEASGHALSVAAKKIKGDLRVGMAENVLLEFSDKYFDIITLFDVLEHLREPKKVLFLINKKLKDDGLLVFSTPDFSSFFSKLQGKKWHAFLPQHLFYFSIKNLVSLLAQTGFIYKKSCHVGRRFSFFYLISHFLDSRQIAAKPLLNFIRLLGLAELTIPINLFDQLLIFAQKK
ncbi:MAG: class I SAM-dependent methyltransferase [Patescibacteria group bacterium]|nr:class I SAM-dependent methyltransferase [Patescibacteria group bacterium]